MAVTVRRWVNAPDGHIDGAEAADRRRRVDGVDGLFERPRQYQKRSLSWEPWGSLSR